ncbi:MAG: FHA domain-containing protein [Dehalococcoidia bacterium]|nr:FHA domain-containing protein [Dehalococcoidia bacterium]
MSRVAIVWTHGDSLRVSDLRETSTNLIGRAPGSAVMIDDKTVSRQQALLRPEGADFVIENLSKTNPTKLNGRSIDAASRIVDGDIIAVGSLSMVFNDLAASSALAGPICSHCARENMASDKDCWYCGTSLVNAATVVGQVRTAVARLASADGSPSNAYSGQAFVLESGSVQTGQAERLAQEAVTAIIPSAGSAVLKLQTGDQAQVNGGPAGDGQTLASGDEIVLGTDRYALILA